MRAGVAGRSAGRLTEGGLQETGSGEVLVEVEGAVVTLNAPDRRNALTPSMAAELIGLFKEGDARPEVGALVVRAVGRSFVRAGTSRR